MKATRLSALLLVIVLMVSLLCFPVSATEAPALNAKAALVVDLGSGRILYELEKDAQRAPASLTKVMTALLTLESLENGEITLEEEVTAQGDCRQGLTDDSSTAGIMPGMTVTVKDLLYCAMLQSANEACNILGTRIAGSIAGFVDRMNEKAAELGCENTHFANPNGMTAEGHYSSAYDLYRIVLAAMEYPLFQEVYTTLSYQVANPGVNGGKPVVNTNALMNPDLVYKDRYLYEGAAGVKTGYTRAAGYCLISTAQREGMEVLAVVMGCDGPFNAGTDEYWNFRDTRALYDWAFDSFSSRTVLEQAQPVSQYGQGENTISLYPAQSLTLTLPKDTQDSEILRTVTVEPPDTLPIPAGAVFGKVTVSIGGEVYSSVDLISREVYDTQTVPEPTAEKEPAPAANVSPVLWVVVAVLLLLFLFVEIRIAAARKKAARRKKARLAKLRRQRELSAREDNPEAY